MNLQQFIGFSIPALQAILAILERLAPGSPEAALAAMQLRLSRGFESHVSGLHPSTMTDCQHPDVVKLGAALPPGRLTPQTLVSFASEQPPTGTTGTTA